MRHRTYVLAVLFWLSVFNSTDNVALALVLQNIKLDLSLTDTELGVLTGIAFALFYSLVGLGVARWADRGDRVAIISATAVVWSVLVAACGTVTNFVQLFLLRVGIGIGEAGYFPASQSLIADYFDRDERPRATAILVTAAGVTYLIGYGVAGWLNELYGWRIMFAMLGMPGLAVAALAWLTLREPRFESSHSNIVARFSFAARSLRKTTAAASASPRLKDVAITLWSNRTLRQLLFFITASSFVTAGISRWQPSFFVRSHGLASGELGTYFALACGIGGGVGPLLGGMWASHYAANNERLQLRVAGGVWCGMTILSGSMYLIPNYHIVFGLFGLQMVATTGIFGPFWAIVQTLVPQTMRATAVAVFMLVGNLLGTGLGPLVAGLLSDALRARFGEESLRYALLLLSSGFLWTAWHLWQASRYVSRDLALPHVGQGGHRCEGHASNTSSTVAL